MLNGIDFVLYNAGEQAGEAKLQETHHAAAAGVADDVLAAGPHPRVLVAVRDRPDDAALADTLVERLRAEILALFRAAY